METTVYVDLFFMINFSMDFLCLFLTSKILNIRFSLFRGIFAAAFGGLYANAALFFPFGSLFCLFLDILAGAVLCLIAFYKKGEGRRAPLYMIVYTAVSMVLGGAMTALFTLFNKTGLFDGIKKTDGDGISVWLFAFLALISGVMTYVGGRFFTGRMARKQVDIVLTYKLKKLRISAMTDSGNLLREPVGGKPCIVADIAALDKILPKEVARIAMSGELFGIEELSAEYGRRISVIPAATASGGGILVGFRMDKIEVDNRGKLYEVDAVIALSNLGDSAEGCAALLPSCLLMG